MGGTDTIPPTERVTIGDERFRWALLLEVLA